MQTRFIHLTTDNGNRRHPKEMTPKKTSNISTQGFYLFRAPLIRYQANRSPVRYQSSKTKSLKTFDLRLLTYDGAPIGLNSSRQEVSIRRLSTRIYLVRVRFQ